MKKVILSFLVVLISITSFTQTDSTSFANSETDKALANAIQKGLQLAETTGEFVVEQASDLVQQFITYRIIHESIWTGVLVIFLVLCAWCTVESFKENEGDFNNLATLGLTIITVLTFFGVIIKTIELLKVIVAPKIYIIEYFINK
jgi:hypothetical protein